MLSELNNDIKVQKEEYKMCNCILFSRPARNTAISCNAFLRCIVRKLLSSWRHFRRLNFIVTKDNTTFRLLFMSFRCNSLTRSFNHVYPGVCKYCAIPFRCVDLISCFSFPVHAQIRLMFILVPLVIVNHTTCFGHIDHHRVCQMGARGSVVGWSTMLQAGRSWVRVLTRTLNFFNLPNPSGRTRPGVHSASKRNEYQKQKQRPTLKADNPTAICEPPL
jgi:hypothetical protein